MIRMLVNFPDSHPNSARELRKIILEQWPIYTIEEYDAAIGIHETRGDHRCSECEAILKEN